MENMNYKFSLRLFISLMLLSIAPFLYQLVRTNLISDIPDTNAFGIAGHIEWFDLIDETLKAFLVTPLYALFNRVYDDKTRFKKRIGQTAVIAFALYSVFSVIVLIKCESLVSGMNTDPSLRGDVSTYLRLETVGFIIELIFSIASVIFVIIGRSAYVCAIIFVKMAGTVIGDLILIPSLGVNGIALSNIAVNLLCAAVCVIMLRKQGLLNGLGVKPTKELIKEYLKVGIFSGAEIFLNNIIYALVVCKMINAVAEQGNYWVANNVIWGLMLIPANALAEIIKKDCAGKITRKHFLRYGEVCGIMFAVWGIFLLVLDPFLSGVMGISEHGAISHIIYTVIPFYVAYAISQIANNIFVGKGKTYFNLIISIIVNLVYYPIVYGMVKSGVFAPSIDFICYMFCFGMLFNMVLGIICYVIDILLSKRKMHNC